MLKENPINHDSNQTQNIANNQYTNNTDQLEFIIECENSIDKNSNGSTSPQGCNNIMPIIPLDDMKINKMMDQTNEESLEKPKINQEQDSLNHILDDIKQNLKSNKDEKSDLNYNKSGIKGLSSQWSSILKPEIVKSNKCKIFCRYIGYALAMFNIIGSAICCIILNVVITNNDHLNDPIISLFVDEISHNIQSKAIMDMQISYTNSCSKGYSLYYIGEWPGTLSGCLIDNQISKNCGNSNITQSSDIIPPESSKFLYNWKNIYFCIQETSDFYLSDVCNKGDIRCSSWCYINATQCPITNISINSENYIPDIMTSSIEFNVLQSPLWLYITRNNSESPLINLTYSFYDLPCINKAKRPSGLDYLLMNISQGCGILGVNNKAKVVDIQNENFLLSTNNMDYLYDKLPNYIDITSTRIALLTQISKYYINYTSINSICSTFENIAKTIIINLIEYGYNIKVMNVISSIFHYSGILMIFFLLCETIKKGKFIEITIYWGLAILLTEFITFGFVYNSHIKSNDNFNIISKIKDIKCFQDRIIDDFFEQFIIYYNNCQQEFQLCIIIFFFSAIPLLNCFVLLFFKCISDK